MRLSWQKLLLMSGLFLIIPGFNDYVLGDNSQKPVIQNNRKITKEIKIKWQPPQSVGVPGRRDVRAGGSRNSCSDLSDSQKNEKGVLTALVPVKNEGRINYEKPKFLIYLPYNSQQNYAYEFVLRDYDNEEEIYKVKTPIKPKPGIISISLPNTISLQKNKKYVWSFTFIFAEPRTVCNPGQIRSGELVEGGISFDKNQPNPILLNKLKTATIEEKITIYTEQGLWYDAIINLAELRRKYPNDANIKAAWMALLKAENLENLAEFTILP